MNTSAENHANLQEIAINTIDQVVVDGLVDGAERRVKLGILIRIGFGGVTLANSEFAEFRDSLADDERYVDRVQSMYGFQPTIRPESVARPSLIAIVGGTALCGEQERKEALNLMNYFADTVYSLNNRAGGILSLREISGTLRSGGLTNLSYQEFHAFLGFMQQDPRFYPIGDGRIVLTEVFTGDIDELTEVSRIKDVAAAVNRALPFLFTDRNGVFTEGVLLGTMKSLGDYVRIDQLQEVFEQLRMSSHVKALEDGRYRLLKDDLDKGSEQGIGPQLSLEAMIKAIRGGAQRKPYSRKKGGTRKRIVNM